MQFLHPEGNKCKTAEVSASSQGHAKTSAFSIPGQFPSSKFKLPLSKQQSERLGERNKNDLVPYFLFVCFVAAVVV